MTTANLAFINAEQRCFEFFRNNLLDIDGGMGGALLGTAQRPAYLGGRGWQFDNGNPLTIIVTPAAANLLIDVSVMFVEFLGPQNYNVG